MVDRLTDLIGGVTGPDLFWAVLVLLAGWLASRVVGRGTAALLVRLSGISPAARSVIIRVVKYAVLLLGVGIALTFLGASLQPLLTAAIIVGVVGALALRGISENFAASVILQTRQAVKIGDEISSGEVRGTVVEMNGRAVVLSGDDGRRSYLPNALILQHPLTNHSQSRAARSEVEIRVRPPAELSPEGVLEVEAALVAVVAALPEVLDTPPARLLTRMSSTTRAIYRLQFWHTPEGEAPARSLVVRALADELRAHHVPGVVTSADPKTPRTPRTAV